MNQFKSLKKYKCVITGGPTREWLDPVRFISNPSSGKMGIALADIAKKLFKETVFIHGPIEPAKIKNKKYKTISVETTEDMLNAVKNELEDNCILIMAAAPADYTPVSKEINKIKKSSDQLNIKLKKTTDILKTISEKLRNKYSNIITVGFAAETTNVENYGLKKLKDKKLDLICINDISKQGAGFQSDTNIMTIYTKSGSRFELPKLSKKKVAQEIFKIIVTT